MTITSPGAAVLAPSLATRRDVDALCATLATSPEPVAVCRGITVVAANSAFATLLGRDLDSLPGHTLFELVAPGAAEAMADIGRRVAQGEALPRLHPTTLLRLDGVEREVDLHTMSLTLDGEPHGLVTAHEAATPLAPPALDHAFYRAVFDVNTAVKLLIDPTSGRIVDANQAAVAFYGWPLDTLRAMRITDINLLTPGEVHAEMQAAVSTRRTYFKFRHRTAPGQVRHVDVHSGPVELDGRALLLSIVHDVTERDTLEEQLRHSHRLEAIGRVAGGVAHDFNNLLTIILTSATILTRRMPDGPLEPYLADLLHAARRAADLTRDLLAFSKREVFRPSPIDLDQVLAAMEGMLGRSLGDRIQVTVDRHGQLPAVYADPAQMEQVVMNLVLNARDAMPDGGPIQIRTRVLDRDALAARGVTPAPELEGPWVELEVEDSGDGIDEDTRSKIFEPFFTTKPPGQGTGLGLATVWSIVQRGRGEIVLETVVGEGTTFHVLLPTAAPAERSSRIPPAR